MTRIDGKQVKRGMTLTAEQCAKVNRIEAEKAVQWVLRNVHVPLNDAQIAGIASFARITSAGNVSHPHFIKTECR